MKRPHFFLLPSSFFLLFFLLPFSLFLFSGCWSFNATEYPKVQIAAAPAGTNTVALGVNGFAATLTEYAAYHEFRTVYVPGFYGRHHYHPGYIETVPTVAYVPQVRQTDAYLRRAKDLFEQAGFAVGAATPDYSVDVAFTGPIVSGSDTAKQLAWEIGTVFFCDYAAASWTAQLRVRDNRTGKLVFHNDYVQRYETNVFGLVPLFSISSATESSLGYMQSWCLGALTDRIVADVAAHFAQSR